MSFQLQRILLLLVAAAFAAPVWAQHGALTIPRNLDQLTDRASVIVHGNIVSTRFEKHPELTGLDTVVVTLRVKETLKGEAGGNFTFRQYVWDIRERSKHSGYQKGQELLLLMIAPSRYGLSSPAGMNQGSFRIYRDHAGKDVAVNGNGNARLFDGIPEQVVKTGVPLSPKSASLVAKHRKGPIAANDLLGLIRELVQRSQ
ncbi:MAG: hypothetical protein ACREVI_14050 [Steroidobacteraceae bacterium]